MRTIIKTKANLASRIVKARYAVADKTTLIFRVVGTYKRLGSKTVILLAIGIRSPCVQTVTKIQWTSGTFYSLSKFSSVSWSVLTINKSNRFHIRIRVVCLTILFYKISIEFLDYGFTLLKRNSRHCSCYYQPDLQRQMRWLLVSSQTTHGS